MFYIICQLTIENLPAHVREQILENNSSVIGLPKSLIDEFNKVKPGSDAFFNHENLLAEYMARNNLENKMVDHGRLYEVTADSFKLDVNFGGW